MTYRPPRRCHGRSELGYGPERWPNSRLQRLHHLAVAKQRTLPARLGAVSRGVPDLIRRAVAAYSTHKPDAVLVEDQGSGTALIQDLKVNHGIAPIAIRPKVDKVTRLSIVSPWFEAGRVYFPRNAAWLSELLAELLTFPQGRFDDQVDSVTYYLLWSRERSANLFEVFWP